MRSPRLGHRLGDRSHHLAADIIEELEVEIPLRPEVLLEDGLGDAGGVGHLLHRRLVEPFLREHVQSDVEQLAAPAGGGQSGHHLAYNANREQGFPLRSQN